MGNITAYKPFRDGSGKTLEMRSQEADRFSRDAKIKDLRAHFGSFYTFGTFESPELRVDWVIDEYGVCMWWEESTTPARRGPESYGTIWVCQDCMLHEANGECGSCHDDEHGHDQEPLSAIEAPFTVAMGMAYEEHAEDCETRIQGQWPDNYECDCETDTFSTSRCEGCGSYLHGERHAMTLFKN